LCGQLDRKFIIGTICLDKQKVLVVIDQHAADERIKLEAYIKDYKISASEFLESNTCTHEGSFVITAHQERVLKEHQQLFKDWGIHYEVTRTFSYENCQVEAKCVVRQISRHLQRYNVNLQNFILTQAQRVNEIGLVNGLPPGILDILKSQACRSKTES
jgi:DNA mismatch repair protein MLH3